MSMIPLSGCRSSSILGAWLLLLFLPAACGDAPAEPDGLESRLAELEQRLADQEKVHTEERKLLVRALRDSSRRLDLVMRAVLGEEKAEPGTGDEAVPAVDSPSIAAADPPVAPVGEAAGPEAITKSTPTESKPTDPLPSKAAPDSTPESGTSGARGFVESLVIFLAVALLLMVVVVVFFPGRLKGSVPQIEYAALEDEAIEGLQDDPEPADASMALAASHQPGGRSVAPGPAAFTAGGPTLDRREDLSAGLAKRNPPPELAPEASRVEPFRAAGEDRPVVHELSLELADADEVPELAEVLDRFLSTEPYILNEPAPQVALDEDTLHLRFFALPSLSEAEHGLLDDAVRRLTPTSSAKRSVG